jgi:hypothetical protein
MIESGEMGKVKWGIATKRMAWPQCVERKRVLRGGSPLPIKTEEPKNAARSLSNLIQLSGVETAQSGCSE